MCRHCGIYRSALKAGDRLALVGRNGAGKTTLLRTLAGIYEPLIGQIKLSGKLSTLLDSSLGMNVDMSGRENITLRGLYNGMSSADINRMAEDVAEFAELGEFLELPVKFYSSGMVLRLAFAMATAVHPEILLMDEWMLAGDANFMEKARARVDAFVNKAEILVLSTHNEEIVLKWATRVIWMDQGRIIQDGPAETVLESYLGRPPIHPVDKLANRLGYHTGDNVGIAPIRPVASASFGLSGRSAGLGGSAGGLLAWNPGRGRCLAERSAPGFPRPV